MQSVILELEPKEINLLASKRIGKSGGLVGAVFSATRIAIQNLVDAIFSVPTSGYSFLNCTVHNVNQNILQLWVVHSLSRRIAAVIIESDQSVSHSYDVR